MDWNQRVLSLLRGFPSSENAKKFAKEIEDALEANYQEGYDEGFCNGDQDARERYYDYIYDSQKGD